MINCPNIREFGSQEFHNENINGIIIDDTFNLIISFSKQKEFKVWNKENLQLISTVKGHNEIINGWDYNDETEILTTFGSTEIIEWDLNEIQKIRTIKISSGVLYENSFLFTQNQKTILSMENNGTLYLIDFNNFSIELSTGNYFFNESKLIGLTQIPNYIYGSKSSEYLFTSNKNKEMILWDREF